MLVLTRREEQKIVFPTMGVTVEVLRIRGNVAKIGIEAPAEIPVLREEIAGPEPFARHQHTGLSREARHALRNRLNASTIALHLLKRQLELGKAADAETTFEKIVSEFTSLERELAPVGPSPVGSSSLARGAGFPARTAAPPASPHLRALLVEDDKNECELLAGYLRMCGFDVTSVNDGADAIAHLASHERPDVVLLDMLMPKCNGARTVELIRRTPQLLGLKVFAISGTNPDDLGVVTGPRGVDRWFAKPVNPESLVREMTRELAQHGAA